MAATSSLPSLKPPAGEEPAVARLGPPHVSLASASKPTGKMAQLMQVLERDGQDELLSALEADPDLAGLFAAVLEVSPYLADLCMRFPAVLQDCLTIGFQETITRILAVGETAVRSLSQEPEIMQLVRQIRAKGALAVALADLGGWWDARRVSRALTDMADSCVRIAVRHLLLTAHHTGKLKLPDPECPEQGSGYCVLAMGKHGAGELNFSSDIDLIVFFDPDAAAILDPVESVAVFVRITKGLVRLLQQRTADGYAYRTDLRLRPDPASMPIAIPLPLALTYYEARGQNWERAALIKARAIAGDPETGIEILDGLAPFVWRRYLDYAAIADIHSIKRQIQSHRDLTSIKAAGHNVKLGKGGIREIEFFVQTQQLIAGGRIPELRTPQTLAMLSLLRDHKWITGTAAQELHESYLFLRDIEHRLQMLDDDQTHTIPTTKKEQQRLAVLCGMNFTQLGKLIERHLVRVEAHYSGLFAGEKSLSGHGGNLSFSGSEDDPDTMETLSRMGFERPQRIIATVRRWHAGDYAALRSAESREALNELTPVLLERLALSGQPGITLAYFDEFIGGLPAGIQLISLLNRNRGLLDLLIRILSAAPRLAALITRRPHVFDGLLEIGIGSALPDRAQLVEALSRTMKQARNYEDGLDRVRAFAAEQRFLIGAYVLSGKLSPLRSGDHYTVLAEVVLEHVFGWVRFAFEKEHGIVKGSEFAVVALGNLGSRELTASSDLDLLFLYRFQPDQDESDGRRSLHASQYYGRFAQRLIAAMSAPTAEGVAYELDFRLRPHGTDGPIATSLHAFSRYHDNDAWTWERMALTRARVILSSDGFGEEVESEIERIVRKEGDSVSPAKDILDMRALMDQERKKAGDWDLKLLPGGLVDLEFLTQWGVLAGRIDREGTTAEKLSKLSESILPNDNVTLVEAFSSLHGTVQLMRLCLEASEQSEHWPDGFRDIVLFWLELPDLSTAQNHLSGLRKAVRDHFLRTLGNDGGG